eukprot:gene8158-1412_t
MSAFEEFGLCPELIKAVDAEGWLLPSPVQAEAIPLILGGGDVMVAAETGSGKTGAFALPVIQTVHEALRLQARSPSEAPTKTAAASSSAAAGGSGASPSSPASTLSTDDRDPIFAVSPGGLSCQSKSEKTWGGGRATCGVYTGLVYYEAGLISFTKNGRPLGVAFQVPDNMKGQIFYPAVCLKNSEMQVNFGSKPFAHGPPSGYVAFSDATASISSLPCTTDAALLVGGTDRKAQLKKLRGGCDIVTGTPGRVIDFVESGDLSLDQVKFFVLDEADRLIDNDDNAIKKIFAKLPKTGSGPNRLQVLLFSATLHSKAVKDMAAMICVNPILVDLKGKDAVLDTVDHCVVMRPRTDTRTWGASSHATSGYRRCART